MLIPDLKKIVQPTWLHKPGFGVKDSKFRKIKWKEQATTPNDSKILQILGIKKEDKILSIASYYANWASFLVRKGIKVDCSDISKSMIDYVKKNTKTKFGKYIVSNYEYIPKKINEYDWTFTFEACGGKQGLPIAYLRSLLNRKGGILVLYIERNHMGSKWKFYPRIVKTLAKIYGTSFLIKKINIKSKRKNKNEYKYLPHRIYIIKTNNKARKLAEKDIKALESNKFSKESLKRLSKLTKIIDKKFLKEV